MLFNPPPWNLAAIPTPDLVSQWPEGVGTEQPTLLTQLLAYSLLFSAAEKRKILDQAERLSTFQLTELLKIHTNERRQWFSVTPENYWHILGLTVTAGLEWLVLLVQRTQVEQEPGAATVTKLRIARDAAAAAEAVLRTVVEGRVAESIAVSSQPLFPLLVDEAIRATGKQPDALLPKWLAAEKLDAGELRVRLTDQSCQAASQAGLPDHVQAYCWERHGLASDERGRATVESERAGWLDRAIEAYERSLSLRPDDADTLGNLTGTLLRKWRVVADPEQKADILAAAATRMEKAMSLDADQARYNYACVLALQGNADRALAELRTLVAQNPSKRQEIAEDEDFAPLADFPEFREIVGS